MFTVRVYRDVIACAEKPVAEEVKAGYCGFEMNPIGIREKVDSREQLLSNAVGGILQVSLGLSHGAIQNALVGDIHTKTTL